MTKETILSPYYKQNKGGLEEWINYPDALLAMEEYAKPYKRIAEAISAIFHYGSFKVETPAEAELEKMLIDVGLWPTTEDEIINRK